MKMSELHKMSLTQRRARIANLESVIERQQRYASELIYDDQKPELAEVETSIRVYKAELLICYSGYTK